MEEFTGKLLHREPLSGGDINEVSLITAEKGRFVEKRNQFASSDFFKKEALGLQLLKKNNLRVPDVLAVSQNYLLLEYLPLGEKSGKSEEAAGRNLAFLHAQHQTDFGLEYDNYIGSLKQENGIYSDWAEFYLTRRIEPMLNRYYKNKKNPDLQIWTKFSGWFRKNVTLSRSSLLHGDIWSGNLYYAQDGPVYIDPSVYYGDFMVDLAYTELFGGFGSRFYSAYREINPIDISYNVLKDVYQIYPLLVHANLFGGHYYASALSRAERFI